MDDGSCGFCHMLIHILIGTLHCSLSKILNVRTSSGLSLIRSQAKEHHFIKIPNSPRNKFEGSSWKKVFKPQVLRATVNRAILWSNQCCKLFKSFYNDRYPGAFFIIITD